jgi:transcriptional regulator with XRE-family HTH domain
MNEVKELRESSGLTQEEAAEKLHINPSTLASYEQGRRTPDYKTMDKIRRELGSSQVSNIQAVLHGSPAQQEVYKVLEGNGRMKRADIADEVRDLSPDGVSQALRGLMGKDLVQKVGHGWYKTDLKDEGRTETKDRVNDSGSLQKVPVLAVGDGPEMEVINESLKIPEKWIREHFRVKPSLVCSLSVRGTSMLPTLKPGQHVYAVRYEGADLRDGAIYALRSDAGAKVKRVELTRIEDGEAVFVRSDNDDFRDYWQRPTEFQQTHDVLARAVQVGQML